MLLVRGALHNHRGAAAKGARDLVTALGIARTIKHASLEARALFELGHALADAGDLPAAEEHLRRAAAIFAAEYDNHEEGRAHASLALLLTRAGRADEARVLLGRAQEAHVDDAEARAEDLLSLGVLELSEGRLAAARAATEKSLALSPDLGRSSGRARMQLGLVARRSGDRAPARAALERAADTFAQLGFEGLFAEAQGQLGIVAFEPGKLAEAKTRLRSACDALGELSRGAAATLFAEQLRALDGAEGGPKPPPDDVLLTKERLERPDATLGSRALMDAAWAGEKLQTAAGAHRVRVAISTLRKLGLPIVTRDDGYALAPETTVVRA